MGHFSRKHAELYQCVVCGQKFEDLWEHLTGGRSIFLNIKDKAHQDYYNKIEACNFDEVICFCGGTIKMFGHGHGEDEVGWETRCQECGFIFDED